MVEVIHSLQAICKEFLVRQQEFVKSHPGDEDILSRRLFESVSPNFLDILAGLRLLEPEYAEDDLKFLLNKFMESLSSIGQAEESLQRSFFYNGLDQLLKDFRNVLKEGLLIQRRQKSSSRQTILNSEKEREFVLQFLES